MSIFTKIGQKIGEKIIGPIIRKEIFKNMDKILEMIGKVLGPIVEKYGTKFLVALGADAALAYMAYTGKLDPRYAVGGIVAITVAYLIVRVKQDALKANGKAVENGGGK